MQWYATATPDVVMMTVMGVLGGLIVLRKVRPGTDAAANARRSASVAAEVEDA